MLLLQQRLLSVTCKVWGAAKFFHPALQQQSVQWDSALLHHLRFISAKDWHKYSVAEAEKMMLQSLQGMLSHIKDPSVAVGKYVKDTSSLNNHSVSLVTFEQSTAIITVPTFQHLQKNRAAYIKQLEAAKIRLDTTQTIILDLRYYPSSTEQDIGFPEYGLFPIISYCIDSPLRLPFFFFYAHKGYQATSSNNSSGGYSTGTELSDYGEIQPELKYFPGRNVVILTAHSAESVHHFLYAFKQQKKAIIFHQGTYTSSPFAMRRTFDVGYGYTLLLNTSVCIDQGRFLAFKPDSAFRGTDSARILEYAINLARKAENKGIRQESLLGERMPQLGDNTESAYKEIIFPEYEYRMLALFRIWNIIQYFFPYHRYTTITWQNILEESIIKMNACHNTEEYWEHISTLLAYTNDSHVNVSRTFSAYYPPITLTTTKEHIVLQSITNDSLRLRHHLQPGDILHKINGKPVKDILTELGKQIPASTPQALRFYALRRMLRTFSSTTTLSLEVEHLNKQKEMLMVVSNVPRQILYKSPIDSSKPFRSISPDIGYIDVSRIYSGALDTAFALFSLKKGLIIDLRKYPQFILPALLSHLTAKTQPIALFRKPYLQTINGSFAPLYSTTFEQTIRLDTTVTNIFRGSIIILISAETVSRGEHFCLAFQTATKAIFVGNPTNGANGDVTSFPIPGGANIFFTGQEVRHADGRQLQRIGIKPDVEIYPTIKGIREGRDEVLEKGIEVLQDLLKKT
jgi:C-terminal processing protease CtpA/Prc